MMTKAVPWDADEVDADLRDAAHRAGRREGQSFGDWLNSVIAEPQQTLRTTTGDADATHDVDPGRDHPHRPPARPAQFQTTDRALAGFEAERQHSRNSQIETARGPRPMRDLPAAATIARTDPDSVPLDDMVPRDPRAPGRESVAKGRSQSEARRAAPMQSDAVPQRSAIESRLNVLFQALERSSDRLGAKRFEPPATTLDEDEAAPAGAADAPQPEGDAARPTRRLLGSTTLSPSRTLDQAIAEINQRQATLSRTPRPRAPRTPVVPLETARAEADTGSFAGLQNDIARMSNRLDAIHSDVAAERAAVPATQNAAFAEIRTMLDRMRPDQSIDSLERRVQDLASKIDEALASRVPMAAFEQLSERIEHVHASLSERLAATAAAAVDTGPIEAVVRDLVGSVRTLQEEGPDVAALEQLMQRLVEKLDEEHDAGVESPQFADLQTQVGRLGARLDLSDAGLTAIVAVERSMGELFSQMEETRDAAINAAENAARTAARDTLRAAMSEGGLPLAQAQRQTDAAVEQVTLDLADMRVNRDEADRRLNAILGALNGTLERVVDRLGALETERPEPQSRPASSAQSGAATPVLPRAAAAPEPAPAATPVAPAPVATVVPVAPAPAPAAPAAAPTSLRNELAAVANPLNAARRARPVATTEPVAVAAPRRTEHPAAAPAPVASPVGDKADFLIEPGASAARRPAGKAPDVSPVAAPDQGAGQTDPAFFIAAARRAAQKAAHASAEDAVRSAAAAQAKARGTADAMPSLAGRAKAFLAARRRPLLLALAGIVMLMGAVQVARLALAPADPTAVAAGVAAPAAPGVAMTAPAPDAGATAMADTTVATAANPPVASPAPAADAGVAATNPAMTPVAPLPTLASAPTANAAVAGQPAALAPTAKGAVLAALPTGLRKMAEEGSASAQYEVGQRLADGRGVARDLPAAADWFEKAAKQGLAPAAYRLGSLYEKGLGVGRDPAAAMQWYQAAADKGNVRAMHNLAVMSAEGSNGKSDYAKAASWFSKAALAGVRDSQFNLAILYARGLGIEQSLPLSYTWFSIAAAQGDTDAATKRDEVAGRLDAKGLADAKKNAENFQPAATIPAANDVTAPPGGWDALSPHSAAAPLSGVKPGGKARVSSM